MTQIVALDANGRNELSLLKTILPLVFGIVGVVSLIAGIFLSRRRNEDAAEARRRVAGDRPRRFRAARGRAEGGAARGRHAAELAGVVPGFDDEATEAAEGGEGPDAAGSRSAQN